MIYCLVSVSQPISSVAFVLHISQCVCQSVCLLSILSFNVPVLALNNVVIAAELLYKYCSSYIIYLCFL